MKKPLRRRSGSARRRTAAANLSLTVRADRAATQHLDGVDDEFGEDLRDAKMIRTQLARSQAGDELGGFAPPRSGRSSVLSEWKFFARGLAAYYRGQTAEMKGNWDRLDTKRKAFSITQRLLRFREADGADTTSERIKAMEKLVFREPILDRLRELNTLVANQDWNKIFERQRIATGIIAADRSQVGRAAHAGSLGSVIKEAARVHHSDAKRLINGFIRVAEPIAFDPRWSRLWAIMWDRSEGMESSESLNTGRGTSTT